MSLFSLGSWITEERKRARKELAKKHSKGYYSYKTCAEGTNISRSYCNECSRALGQLLMLRRLAARLRRGR